MRPIDRLQKGLGEFRAKLREQRVSETKFLRDAKLPDETFKSIRRGHLPSDHAVRVKLAGLFGYGSVDQLFGPSPESRHGSHKEPYAREFDRPADNPSLRKAADPSGVEDRPMTEIEQVVQRLKTLPMKDQVRVIELVDRLYELSVLKEGAALRPPTTKTGG